jgi:hypothetical protein
MGKPCLRLWTIAIGKGLNKLLLVNLKWVHFVNQSKLHERADTRKYKIPITASASGG